MKEILEAISIRIKSPVFGYFILSFTAINWKPLFFLIADNSNATERIAFFDQHTNYYSLLIYPLIFSVIAAILYPWINYVFLWISRTPSYLRNSIFAEAEHRALMIKKNYEELRNSHFSMKENELIGQAKRDEEILNIENQELRENLQKQIDELRNQKDINVNSNSAKNNLFQHYMDRAEEYKSRGDDNQAEKMYLKAFDIESSIAPDPNTYQAPGRQE